MSGRRRRGLLATVLGGGPVGRRIRVKAVLLASSRGDLNKLGDWVKWEMAKAFIPLGLAALALSMEVPIPLVFVSVLFAGAVGWSCFVAGHAYTIAFRMNGRHAAHMKAAGVDTDLRSILADKALWRKSAGGMTMREFIAARRTIPPCH